MKREGEGERGRERLLCLIIHKGHIHFHSYYIISNEKGREKNIKEIKSNKHKIIIIIIFLIIIIIIFKFIIYVKIMIEVKLTIN